MQFTSVRVVCNNTLQIALGYSSGAIKVPHCSQFDPDAVKCQLGIGAGAQLKQRAWDEVMKLVA